MCSEWKEIQVKQKTILVDKDIAMLIKNEKIDIDINGYARIFSYCKKTKKTKHQHVHKKIMGPGIVDHINGNKLDNRRRNLRITDKSGNSINRPKQKGKYSSKYRGVGRFRGVWRAYAEYKGKQHHLGIFKDQESAARARDLFWEKTGEPFVENIKKLL